MRPRSLLLGVGLLCGWWTLADPGRPAVAAEEKPSADAVDFFETKVRPTLVDSCLRCHGPQRQSSGLRLDSREAILEGGENGPSIVPGEPDKSLLVQAIRHTHDDIRMPPKAKLPDETIAAVAEWVKRGAPWPKGVVLSPAARDRAAETHWAFRPVRDVEPPAVKDRARVASPVDAFILARLEEKGMAPAPLADKRTLIRRATFDLTGLPPTPEEVDAFEADTSPDAFARVVDRLLASPRYGERWGRHWLDVARYADTKGYVFTEERRYFFAYTYRDYVIRAFNEDLPYDQFLIQQIAADRLPLGEDTRPLAALGFLTVGRRFLNDGNDIIDDRIDVVTRGLLGLTVACARCHDHKYDPIPTEDYYSLHGVFASSVEPGELPLIKGGAWSPENSAEAEAQRKAIEKELDDFLAAKRAEIQDDLRGKVAVYLRAAADLEFNPRHPKLDERARADAVLPGRLRWAIEHWKGYLTRTSERKDPLFLPWHALAPIPSAEFAGKAVEQIQTKVGTPPTVPALVLKTLTEPPPTKFGEIVSRYGDLLVQAERKWRERLKQGPAQALDEPDWETLRQVLYLPDGPVTLGADDTPMRFTQNNRRGARLYSPDDRNKLIELRKSVEQRLATLPGAPPRAMVLNDSPKPVDPHVFVRGNPGRPGKPVPRQFLKVLSAPERKPFAQGSGRLELARAIADPSNPLTARVLVNRVWLQHFGAGLVATPSDFGLRSDPPSHPELLDFLAAEFMKGGWSVKALHRRIMLSSTYRQRSENDPAYQERDPENRLLGKYPRRRLDFESMRDALLAVSGTLDPTVGGRSLPLFEPPFPPRRTVYGFIDRQNLDGVYRTFDFASPDATSPRRYVTTVPQQALFLMNSPFVIEQARHLAESLAGTSDPEARIRDLYRRIFGRAPESHEIELGLRFIAQQQSGGNPAPAPMWQFGFGRFDESTRRVGLFERFPHWSGSAWQFGPVMPHPEMHYLNLNAAGGHVGNDADHAAIRRWTAPRDAVIAIDATLEHESPNGDGVRGRIVAARGGELGSWAAHHAKVQTRVERYEVKKGETIDFVVDCRSEPSFDSFVWSPIIREVSPTPSEWMATAGFQGPPPPALSAWGEYAQVLLLTNEFLFVD